MWIGRGYIPLQEKVGDIIQKSAHTDWDAWDFDMKDDTVGDVPHFRMVMDIASGNQAWHAGKSMGCSWFSTQTSSTRGIRGIFDYLVCGL